MVLIRFMFIFFDILLFLSQKKNFINVHIFKLIFHIIYIKKVFVDVRESFTSYEKVFNSARCLTCYTLMLLFLFEYKVMCKSCVIGI